MHKHQPKTPTLVRSLLKGGSGLIGGYIQHIEFLQNLEQKLLIHLTPPVNRHCTIANYANNTLLLHTDAPAWASRIRYSTPGILRFLQNECGLDALKTIRIKVIPSSSPSAQLPGKCRIPDEHTANLIRQSAATVTDEFLRHALEKISGHFQGGR